MPKILIFDIETSPNIAHVWQFWQQNIGAKQLLEDGRILCFAAKWLGDDEVIYVESRRKSDKALVKKLHKLIDEADILVGHNGKKFDLGWFKSKAAIHGLKPPSPVKIIDTYISTKKEFYFPSYRLEYLARIFNCEEKETHKKFPGHELWLECLKGNNEAWEEMKNYNIQDVLTLEELYLKMRPWISNHPNIGVYSDDTEITCSKCGSTNMHRDGYYYTNVGKYQQYQCNEPDCGGWARGRTNLKTVENRTATTNAL